MLAFDAPLYPLYPVPPPPAPPIRVHWAIPYYDAFDRHGIGYISYDFGIPLMNEVDKFCNGKASREDIRTSR